MCVQLLLHLRVGRQQVEAEDARVGGVVHTCLLLLLSTPACKKLKYSCLYLLAKKSNTDCKTELQELDNEEKRFQSRKKIVVMI